MEVKRIIDKLFYKDVAGIIEGFLFVDCKYCNNEVLEDNGFESIDNKYYCRDCIKNEFINKCLKCDKYYSSYDCGIKCFWCFSLSCKLYCERCYFLELISTHVTEMVIPHLDLFWTTDDIEFIMNFLDDVDN